MLTQEIVREHINYDPQTGIVKWIKPRARRVKVGDTVDCLIHGYLRIVLYSKYYALIQNGLIL
jgi:hypothetical protein